MPLPPAAELQEVPPLSEGLLVQVIKGNLEPVIRAAKSDESIEQIEIPNGILDRQE